MYFSDVYTDRRVPHALTQDPVLYGECLSGALYWNDFLHTVRSGGFGDPRLVADRPIAIANPELASRTGMIRFSSAIWRLFRIEDLEPACEDYGQSVCYRGTLAHFPHAFRLDRHHLFETGRQVPVCGNTWRMLHDTRFRDHFEFSGDFSRHFGTFPGCGSALPFGSSGPGREQTTPPCC